MIYRTAAIFIVLFWLTMTGLLVHQEIRPSDSALREIPVSHVVKLFFMHHMHRVESDPPLSIFYEKLRLGELKLIPQVDETTQDRSIEFHGNVQVSLFGEKRQRIAFNGLLNMDKLLTTKRFQLEVTTRAPTEFTTDLVILPKENVAHYELHSGGEIVDEHDYTLDENGAKAALKQAGLEQADLGTSLLPSHKPQTPTDFSIKARLSSLTIHGGEMDTFLVTIVSNGQTLLECHVDQLGRIVHASTLLGYTLTPMNDIAP